MWFSRCSHLGCLCSHISPLKPPCTAVSRSHSLVASLSSLGASSPSSPGGVPSSLTLCVSWATPRAFLQMPSAPSCFPMHLTAPHAFTCLVPCLPQPFARPVLHQLLLASRSGLSLSPTPYRHPNQAACSSCQGCRHGRAPPASPLVLEAVFNVSFPLNFAEGPELRIYLWMIPSTTAHRSHPILDLKTLLGLLSV